MTTRRRITCLILSAFLFGSCSVLGPDTSQRVVRAKVFADIPFRARNPSWAEEARGLVEAASDYYEREFDIRILPQSVSAWPSAERVDSTPALLSLLQKQFPVALKDGSYDLIVSFTAENTSRYLTAGRPRVDRIGDCSQGLSNYIVVPVGKVFHYRGAGEEPEFDVIALVHELAHVFGAQHVEDTTSLMHENFGYRTEIDAKNRAIIRKNRSCPFAK
ncbi:MAG TPA: M12 family metallo-peptidase [Candidatus Binatia bacterium]|nr:M12 family metallo-peptidase [Candidatus Binatia bacterium]